MRKLKNELEIIDDRISILKDERTEILKKCVKCFNEKCKIFLNNGFKMFKFKSLSGIRYILTDDISAFHIVLNSNKTREWCSIHIKGLSFFKKEDVIVLSDMAVLPFDDIFTFFDEITEIDIYEFNTIVNQWVDYHNNEYFLNPEEGDEPLKEWFSEFYYEKYFSKYLNIINNEKINEKIETEINKIKNGD